MANRRQIFDDQWLKRARAESGSASWGGKALATLDTTGGIYLCTLRMWFDQFPLTQGQKRQLRSRLESFRDDEHLGGVNELAWWAFMRREGVTGNPLPASSAPRPDFELQPPADCFVEVSTLNVSDKDKKKFEHEESVALDHAETIRRVVGKLTAEKQRQMMYAADRKKPFVLALFDYTTWSGFGTLFFRTLGEFLLGRQIGFKTFPPELAAIVYLERKVLPDGRIALSRHRSAVYYNPLTPHPLPVSTFPSFNQFWLQLVSTEPRSTDYWIYL
jgi:hypothetical protein